MRLLTYDNRGELQLTHDLAENEIPRYAILSHTWGADEEEVTFHGLRSKSYKKKSGYVKIELCGKQAVKDGWEHFWVDTCCIDKADHVELSMAVTRMYRWYQHAQVCYVYLADVSSVRSRHGSTTTSTSTTEGQAIDPPWQSSFRRSRWFTRGWTLQELLAPREVVFYSKEWVRLGTRTDLQELLHEITSIPIAALNGLPPSRFPVSERMRWTHGRVTKQKEDGAYCLLGLFNVFMPLDYGEGDNAFRRLQKEIDDRSDGNGGGYIHNKSFRGPAAFQAVGLCLTSAPLILPDEFVGRDTEIGVIHDILQPNDMLCRQRQAVLCGMNGIGKTQLAIAYIRKHQHSYTSVLWLNATSELTLYTSLRSIARELRTGQVGLLDKEQLLAALYGWLSHPGNTRWLLVFDNYSDPDSFNLDRVCPKVDHGSIIVTSRLSNIVPGSCIRVEPLNAIDDGLDILQMRSGRVEVHDGARCLAKRLGGLPLALVTAGAYLSTTTITFQQYLDAYEECWLEDPCQPPGLQEYRHQNWDRTLYTTWNLSYSRLLEENVEAAQMLKLLAYFDHQEIWYELFQGGLSDLSPEWLYACLSDQVHFEDIMGTLVDYCLVEVQHETQSYSVHSCVHKWTLQTLNHEVDAQLYWYAFDCVAASIDKGDWERLGELRYARISHHAVRLAHDRFTLCDQLESCLLQHLDEATWIAQMLRAQVQLFAAERTYIRALAGYEQAFGANHALTLNIVNNLGSLYAEQGKLERVEQMYLRAFAGYKQALGPNHISTVDTISNLGVLYADQGKFVEAEQMYVRALAGYKQALGPHHTSTLRTLSNLGNLYAKQGKLEKAERTFSRALARYKEVFGPDHTLSLRMVDNIGAVYARQGKPEKAEQMYLQALAGYEQALGSEHALTLRTVDNLGLLYAKLDRLEKAENNFQRVVSVRTRALGPEHRKTLQAVDNLNRIKNRACR